MEGNDSKPEIDVVAFCASCGCNDPALFSQRMLHRFGRFGERTRRCKQCVAAAEASGQTNKKLASEIANRWEAAQAVQRQSATGWEKIAKQTGSVHAANALADLQVVAAAKQAEALRAQAAVQASRDQERAAKAAAKEVALVAAAAEAADPKLRRHATDSHTAEGSTEAAAEVERRRKKLLKALRAIDELKERRADGYMLEATQREKIAREATLRSELRELEHGYLFLMPSDSDGGGGEPAQQRRPEREDEAEAGDGRASKKKRLQADDDEVVHRSATFALGDADVEQQPQKKKKKKAQKPHIDSKKPRAHISADPSTPTTEALMAHLMKGSVYN